MRIVVWFLLLIAGVVLIPMSVIIVGDTIGLSDGITEPLAWLTGITWGAFTGFKLVEG